MRVRVRLRVRQSRQGQVGQERMLEEYELVVLSAHDVPLPPLESPVTER